MHSPHNAEGHFPGLAESPVSFVRSARCSAGKIQAISGRVFALAGEGFGVAINQAGFLLTGLTPSVDGRPKVSRRWATEVIPRAWKLSSISSDVSRTSPTVFRPADASALRIRAGSSTSLIGVASGSSGVGSNIIWSLIPVQVPE